MVFGILEGLGAPLIGAAAGLLGGERANSSARAERRAANAFTERQLKNRHQWEVEDLRKAGLNPVLSAHGTPSIGGSQMAQVINPADSMAKGMVAATSAAQLKKLNHEIKKIKQETFESAEREILNVDEQFKKREERREIQARTDNIRKQTEILGHQEHGHKVEGDIDQSDYGKMMRYLNRMNSGGALSNFIGNLKKSFKPKRKGFSYGR